MAYGGSIHSVVTKMAAQGNSQGLDSNTSWVRRARIRPAGNFYHERTCSEFEKGI